MTAASVIEVRDLRLGWSEDQVLLEHAAFDVKEGEIFGILGRSASGKTTLLRVLIGLEEPLGGSVYIRGLGPPRTGMGRPPYGVMFQSGALFGSMTVGENVALPLERYTHLSHEAIDAMVRAKLRLVGLQDAEHQLPATLSGGMLKRAAIARAMALEPSLIFLDEPASGLDPVTAAELDRLIVTLARGLGLTVVMVTHELGTVNSIVDRCVLLDRPQRKIIAQGEPGALRASQVPSVRQFFQREPAAT
jgi:phospholipid/cholesterol/gamma-HCH transport system ATP-binding protein